MDTVSRDRTLHAEAPPLPERDDFGRQLRSSSGFHAASTPPEVAFMRPLGDAARAGDAGVLLTSDSTTVSTAAPSSAASQRSAASSAAGSRRRQQHKSAGSLLAAASSVRSSGAASFRSFGGFSGGRPAGVFTLTPPQVSASPAVPTSGPASGAAASAAGAAAAGTPAAGAPATGFRIPVPPPQRVKRSRGHPLALSSVPELPPATYLAPPPVPRPPAAGQETPLELRLMHPLGRALRDTAADLLGSGEQAPLASAARICNQHCFLCLVHRKPPQESCPSCRGCVPTATLLSSSLPCLLGCSPVTLLIIDKLLGEGQEPEKSPNPEP